MKILTAILNILKLLVNEFVNALRMAANTPRLLFFGAVIDALFFIVYGFFLTPVNDKIIEHSVLIGNQISTMLAKGQTGILLKLFEPELRALTGKLILATLLGFFITYLIYCIFHGTSWHLARKITSSHNSWRHSLLGFAKVNLIWLFLAIIYKFIDVYVSMRFQILKRFVPEAVDIWGGALTVIAIIGIFAAVISYSKFETFALFTKYKTAVPLALALAVLFLNAQYFTNLMWKLFNVANGTYIHLVWIGLLFTGIVMLLKVYTLNVMRHD